MKASLLTLALAIATLQTTLTPPQAGQRGPAPTPSSAQPAPLDAEHCKCSIEVTVKRNGTGETIGEVEVSLTQSNTQVDAAGIVGGEAFRTAQAARTGSAANNTLTALTDNNGRAVFRDLAEGSYAVQAKRDGYFSSANGYPPQATGNISVGPAKQAGARGTSQQPVQQITLNMVQGAILSGRIEDANHRPARAVSVAAYRTIYERGHRILTQTGTAAQTDDRGEYRLFWFPPGEYYVRTGGPGGTAGPRLPVTRNGETNVQAPTYHPGTLDPKAAVALVVHDGNDLSGINFSLQPSTGVTVSGMIINTLPGGRPDRQGRPNRSISSYFFVPHNPYFFETPMVISNIDAARGLRGANFPNDSETPFEIHGVLPGTYDFYPVFSTGTAAAGTSGAVNAYFTGRTLIEVGTENVTGIQAVIHAGTNLKGHVTVTGTPPPAAPGRPASALNLTSIRIQVDTKDNLPALVRETSTANAVDAAGVFTMDNLIDAQYFISGVRSIPPDAFISEIRQDSRSIFDEDIITIGKEPQSTLEVVISRGGGTIQGTVQDGRHNPVAARITLIPDMPRRQNVLLYKSVTSNAMGTFNLTGLTPGAYKLFAWEQNPSGAEQNPEFIREYDALGVSVNVVPGLPLANIQVPLIPAKH